MPTVEDVDISGTLAKVTPSGKYAVIRLTEPRSGLAFAVINDATQGRIGLMNRLGGPLVRGAAVRIRKLEQRSEAFIALQVE